MNLMKVSVNILTWNCFKTLIQTMAILKRELSGINSEIIVVDNGSTDFTESFMKLECQLIRDDITIKYIRNEQNLGICKGKNQGIDASNGEYIMLIDGDIVPVPNSVLSLVTHLDNTPECEAIGFLPNKFTLQKNRNGQINHEEFCAKLDPIEPFHGHCIYYGIYRKGVFSRIRFDEEYGPGYDFEDLDFYMQMQEAGIKQYAAGINHQCGKYYHEINSSIRNMGHEAYMNIRRERAAIFKRKWEGVHVAI